MNYISLFSCAGIGCYGFHLENFKCLSTVEIEPLRMNIQRYNNKCIEDQYYINKDITLDETKQQLYKNINNKKIDILIATPPCQGMSALNKKKNQKDINRNSLVVESIKLIKEIKPSVFVFENVRSFLKTSCQDIDGMIKPINNSIIDNLDTEYTIESKIINFKDYGSKSSRTRTLVIGIKKELNINPELLFPDKSPSSTIKEVIGYLKSLQRNEISEDDILHFSRKMNDRHYLWMKNTPMGKSAFRNENKLHIPHIIDENGLRKEMSKNMGDKFSRLKWDDTMKCIHTRSDAPNSQHTIHPSDTRVFSIKELMLLQGVNLNFKWSELSYEELNSLPLEEKQKWLKKNERLIRTVIGESVPTIIFQQIAKKCKKYL